MIYIGQQQVEFNAITEVEKQTEPQSRNDVTFIDYDGTILTSYTASEALALTSMPTLPFHSGLSAQGWNYTLEQMKSNVSSTGKCNIGCMYTTDDGKTRIKLTIQDPKYTTIPIVFQQTSANGVKVNWGDGSVDQTYSSTSQQTISHTYAPSAYPATYIITFQVTSGTMSFPTYIMGISMDATTDPKSAFVNMIDEVSIGNNVTSIGTYAFSGCYSIASITIPSSVTSIGTYAFSSCASLASITIPSSVTSIGTYTFSGCYSIASITIPSSVTSIGTYAFQACYSLASITIPSSVRSIGKGMFSSCYSIASITIPSSVTSIGTYAFSSCYSLTSITIQSSITSIENNTFQSCYSLASITIPSSVRSIGNYAFQNCYSLASITIPSLVTRVGTYAFYYCYGMKTFDFRRSTSVPTLSNVNAFQYTSTVKEIIVPDELYDTWIAATNWNSTTNQISTSIVKASQSSLGPL